MNLKSIVLTVAIFALAACATAPIPTASQLRSDVLYFNNTKGGQKAAEDVRQIHGGNQAIALVDQPLPETRSPSPLFQPPPQYPPDASGRRRQGSVAVDFIVGESGEVLHAAIRNSTYPELNEIVLAAVKTWRFTPARREGSPVRFRIITLLKFDPGR